MPKNQEKGGDSVTTMSLFGETSVEEQKPDPLTTVQVGSRVAQIPLHRRRREACNRLIEILQELEGKDIYIGSYDAGGRHYWVNNLKLPRLKLDWYPPGRYSKGLSPLLLFSGEAGQLK